MLLPLPLTLLASVASASPFAIYRPEGNDPKVAAVAKVQGSYQNYNGFDVPLHHTEASVKRELAKRSGLDLDDSWLVSEAQRVNQRYNTPHVKRQQSGFAQLQDNGKDASYAGQVSVGTPAQTFPVILDTGSADFWIESSKCPSCPGNRFDETKSSTYKASTSKFSITYGSGDASGLLGQDAVSLGGYANPSQTFALVDQMKEGLITTAVTGIMGLAFQSLSYSKAQPWWQAVSGSWNDKLFAFQLKRFRDVPTASNVEADGGVANFGYLDSSLYSGAITYVPLASNPQYWHITMGGINVQGTDVSISGADQVAIDTGTTLIGGPESIVTAIYAAIPGSKRMSGTLSNYFEYPCSTTIDVKLNFGGHSLAITNADFDIGHSSSNGQGMCTGGIFVQALSNASPVNWIVGATALKNSYTVFRSDPPSIGFANLAGDGPPAETAIPSDPIPGASSNDSSATSSGGSSSSASSTAPSSSATPTSSQSVVTSDGVASTVYVVASTPTESSANSPASAAESQLAGAASRSHIFTPLLLIAAVPLLL